MKRGTHLTGAYFLMNRTLFSPSPSANLVSVDGEPGTVFVFNSTLTLVRCFFIAKILKKAVIFMKLLLLIVILFITANIFTAVTLNFKKESWTLSKKFKLFLINFSWKKYKNFPKRTVIHSLFNKL